jgi:hypothetical protein
MGFQESSCIMAALLQAISGFERVNLNYLVL